MIFRNDDVSATTDFHNVGRIYDIIGNHYPEAIIWSCVNIACKRNELGSVHPGLPLKEKPLEYFYEVDKIWRNRKGLGTIASHGLIHADHTQMSREMQEMSIVMSCRLLDTELFVPPFNKYNDETRRACSENDIILSDPSIWRSLEFNDFDPSHKLWCFHSWRWTAKRFEEKIWNGSLEPADAACTTIQL